MQLVFKIKFFGSFQCFDTSMCRDGSQDNHIGPAAQQISKRGPVLMIDNRDKLERADDPMSNIPTVTMGKTTKILIQGPFFNDVTQI